MEQVIGHSVKELLMIANSSVYSEQCLANLFNINRSLWKMINIHRIAKDPIYALRVPYLDPDLVEFGIAFIGDQLSNYWDEVKTNDRKEFFTTLSILILYHRYRTSSMPMNILMVHFIDIIYDMICENTIIPVLKEDIWGYYKKWVEENRISNAEYRQIEHGIQQLIKNQVEVPMPTPTPLSVVDKT